MSEANTTLHSVCWQGSLLSLYSNCNMSIIVTPWIMILPSWLIRFIALFSKSALQTNLLVSTQSLLKAYICVLILTDLCWTNIDLQKQLEAWQTTDITFQVVSQSTGEQTMDRWSPGSTIYLRGTTQSQSQGRETSKLPAPRRRPRAHWKFQLGRATEWDRL